MILTFKIKPNLENDFKLSYKSGFKKLAFEGKELGANMVSYNTQKGHHFRLYMVKHVHDDHRMEFYLLKVSSCLV